MDCRTFQRNLEDYLQGDLDFAGRFGIERHAQQCYACGRTLEGAQKLGDAARRVGRVKAPQGFEDAVMRRIQSARIRRRPGPLGRLGLQVSGELIWRRAVFAGSLAFLLLVVGAASLKFLLRQDAAGIPAVDADVAGDLGASPPPVVPIPASAAAGPPELVRLGRGYFDSERGWVSETVEPVDGEFIELPTPGSPERMVRLPKSIRVRHAPPSEEYFILHVSH